MIENNEQQIEEKRYEPKDELVMNEMRKMSDTVLPKPKTKSYYLKTHPELETNRELRKRLQKREEEIRPGGKG